MLVEAQAASGARKFRHSKPIPHNIAKAWVNYISFLNEIPNRLEVKNSSLDDFTVLAGGTHDTNPGSSLLIIITRFRGRP